MKKVLFFSLIVILFQSCYSESALQSTALSDERAFSELMIADSLVRKSRAAAAVNQFLNDSPRDSVAAVLIENNSNCNIILKINGANNYLLPIAKFGKNYVVLPKGNYHFQSKLCNADYRSFKNIQESISVILSKE